MFLTIYSKYIVEDKCYPEMRLWFRNSASNGNKTVQVGKVTEEDMQRIPGLHQHAYVNIFVGTETVECIIRKSIISGCLALQLRWISRTKTDNLKTGMHVRSIRQHFCQQSQTGALIHLLRTF